MATCLIIIGAALEALGFVTVALDLREVERESTDLRRHHKRIQVGAALAGAGALAAEGMVSGGGGLDVAPSLEERVEHIERELKETTSSLLDFERREKEYHRQILDRTALWVGEARMEAFELVQDTRRTIGQAIAGNVWRKRIGLAVFLVGLGVQTAGNILSL